MGMSTYIKGVRNLDGTFQKMINAKLACDAAGISYPPEVEAYFDGEAGENESYLRDKMQCVDLEHPCVLPWSEETSSGYQVDISHLPEDIKAIRFINSW